MNSRSDFVEFSVYDEILNGSLRPFFVDSFSNQEIRKVLNELEFKNSIKTATEELYLSFSVSDGVINDHDDFREMPPHESLAKDDIFDNQPGNLSEKTTNDCMDKSNNGIGLLLDLESPISDEYLDRDKQPEKESKELFKSRVEGEITKLIGSYEHLHQSQKAKQFKQIIQNEFENIIQRILDLKETISSENELKKVINRDIKKAKKLSEDASELSVLFKEADPKWGYPNAFIVDMVKTCLVNSIKLYQLHFGTYIDHQLESNDVLKELSDHGKPSWPILKKLEEGQIPSMNEYVEISRSYPVQAPSDAKKNGNRFIFKGDFWEISYCGNETNIRNLERTKYIVRLLEKPNEDFHCHELVLLVKGDDPYNYFAKLAEIDPIESDDQTEAWQGRINFVNPIEDEISPEELDACINVADGLWQQANDPKIPEEEREKAKKYWTTAQYHYGQEYGLFFYESKTGDLRSKKMQRLRQEFERCRTNVKRQISNALLDIGEKDPLFCSYLKNHIQTGIKCVFKPDPNEVPWIIDWGK
jgi:hypothetical protein